MTAVSKSHATKITKEMTMIIRLFSPVMLSALIFAPCEYAAPTLTLMRRRVTILADYLARRRRRLGDITADAGFLLLHRYYDEHTH